MKKEEENLCDIQEAENGLQRTAKQSSRLETVKNAKQNNRNGKQAISELSKLF